MKPELCASCVPDLSLSFKFSSCKIGRAILKARSKPCQATRKSENVSQRIQEKEFRPRMNTKSGKGRETDRPSRSGKKLVSIQAHWRPKFIFVKSTTSCQTY